jgi:hypothetical protein
MNELPVVCLHLLAAVLMVGGELCATLALSLAWHQMRTHLTLLGCLSQTLESPSARYRCVCVFVCLHRILASLVGCHCRHATVVARCCCVAHHHITQSCCAAAAWLLCCAVASHTEGTSRHNVTGQVSVASRLQYGISVNMLANCTV